MRSWNTLADAEEHLARVAGLDALAAARLGVAPRHICVPVDVDEGNVEAHDGAVKPAVAADGAGGEVVLAEVPGGEAALGDGVELGDGLDAEAVLELVPDVRAEAVAKGDAHLVLLVERGARDGVKLRWGCEEVAQRLANVLDDGGFRVAHLGPEGLGGELAAECLRAAGEDGGAEAEEAGGGVVEWHGLDMVRRDHEEMRS
ncbi:hypothetical protein G7046_g6289 [Stylonectria norvegica]|nr:hypothetical protein G7046_g6289 [Stylonectria norvegica]